MPANTQPLGGGYGSGLFTDSRCLGGHSRLGSGLPSACNPNPFPVMLEPPPPPKALDPVSERELILAGVQQLQNAVLDILRIAAFSEPPPGWYVANCRG